MFFRDSRYFILEFKRIVVLFKMNITNALHLYKTVTLKNPVQRPSRFCPILHLGTSSYCPFWWNEL
jgi:hypothetical protein